MRLLQSFGAYYDVESGSLYGSSPKMRFFDCLVNGNSMIGNSFCPFDFNATIQINEIHQIYSFT
jgi:hypothetical protein